MNRVRAIFSRPPAYSPLHQDPSSDGGGESSPSRPQPLEPEFSRTDYTVFVLLGVNMLWAWNMFLASAPYFESQFQGDAWMRTHIQSSIISVSSTTNLLAVLLLTFWQSGITYPSRISWSCIVTAGVFALLTLSAKVFAVDTVDKVLWYFVFLLSMVLLSSFATALSQNGVFAYVSGLGNPRYMQGVMVGQAIAGILAPLAQMVTVLSAGEVSPKDAATAGAAATDYFIIATLISVLALVAFGWHLRRQDIRTPTNPNVAADTSPSATRSPEEEPKRHVALFPLLYKLRWLAGAVFLCFAITMFFAVYTAAIHSIHESIDTSTTSSRLNTFPVFVPLAFFFWNLGDLSGRMLTALPNFNLSSRPRLLFAFSIFRVIWIPMYYLCNIRNRGASVQSDVFYLVIVQYLFGLGNGWLGSNCMMGASSASDLENDEKQAAGGVMSMCLVAGLTVGSLLSFTVHV